MAGMTDPLILDHAIEMAGKNGRKIECSHEEIYVSYLEFLLEELDSDRNHYQVLPGVLDTLEELSGRNDLGLGLATGNISEGARIKLEHGKIYHYFGFGGFGSDHHNRTYVVQQAVQRGEEYVAPAAVTRSIVIGDTPRDIIHARKAGAEVIAVASGFHHREVLAELEPDLLLDSLEERKPLFDFLGLR